MCKWSTNSTTGAPLLLLAGLTGTIRVVDCHLRKVVWVSHSSKSGSQYQLSASNPSLFCLSITHMHVSWHYLLHMKLKKCVYLSFCCTIVCGIVCDLHVMSRPKAHSVYATCWEVSRLDGVCRQPKGMGMQSMTLQCTQPNRPSSSQPAGYFTHKPTYLYQVTVAVSGFDESYWSSKCMTTLSSRFCCTHTLHLLLDHFT